MTRSRGSSSPPAKTPLPAACRPERAGNGSATRNPATIPPRRCSISLMNAHHIHAQNRTRRHGPQDQQGWQARGLRHPRHLRRDRHRDWRSALPSPFHGRQSRNRGSACPRSSLGLFPGAGGTTRVIRAWSAPWPRPLSCWKAKCCRPEKGAKSAQLIDEIVAARRPDGPREANGCSNATDADIVKPWDQKGWKMPGGAPYHPVGFPHLCRCLAP